MSWFVDAKNDVTRVVETYDHNIIIILYYIMLCYVMLYYIILYYIILYILYYIILCYVMLCYIILYYMVICIYIYIYYNVYIYIIIYIIHYSLWGETQHDKAKKSHCTTLETSYHCVPNFRRVPRSFWIPAGRATFVMSCWFTSL